ncbi:P-loop ATPase, Sll1717 family [Pseudomonas syringae group genomosp. 3]|uniref:P-loop ATPase, Sll1717 family n=1 Tax=Pseudomonas syringae group genomosp. 3 TaxID=251701 RepID=UPI000EFEA962|nr:hypothetical protein [Pseudomonas syringae group genomosp. 3]QQN26292.1 hypothetical protein JHZ65_21985 [Pseudomonas syringae pv. maculicola]RMO77184.1 hypothetical protein ALQ34_02382 [Pseudomonas syringae pv. maculicola]
MISINLRDKKLFGNEAGEDEELEYLNAYYIDNEDFDDFYDADIKLSIVSARKGMGKSALLSRLDYKLSEELSYGSPIVIRVKGNELIGLGAFSGCDHSYLENYWKKIIFKKILIEVGARVGIVLSDDNISMIEYAELESVKSKKVLGLLLSKVLARFSILGADLKKSFPENSEDLIKCYQESTGCKSVWLLIDDIDAKFQNNTENQARVGAFFSAIRSLAFDCRGLNIRTTVRSDVWSCLRHLEDLDKLQQYIISIFWTKRQMRDMLAQKVLVYIINNYPDSSEAKFKIATDYNKILDMVFTSPIEWASNKDAKLFDAISAFSNRRPRWMGQLCRMAGKKAKEKPLTRKVTLEHINYILSDFGANRRDDLIKEHIHQFDELNHLIDALRATKKEFSCSELEEVLELNFLRGRTKDEVPSVDGKPYVGVEDLADFLYKLGLISHIHLDGREFTHFTDDPDLYRSTENRRNNVKWSLHPSYRKFLNIH